MPSALRYGKKMHDVSHSIADLCFETTPELGNDLFGCSSSDLAPNAQAHLLPEAGATQERTLEAVRCSALFGWVRDSTTLTPQDTARDDWISPPLASGTVPGEGWEESLYRAASRLLWSSRRSSIHCRTKAPIEVCAARASARRMALVRGSKCMVRAVCPDSQNAT
jgi:hypothetical protein